MSGDECAEVRESTTLNPANSPIHVSRPQAFFVVLFVKLESFIYMTKMTKVVIRAVVVLIVLLAVNV